MFKSTGPIIAVAVCLLITLALFFFGPTKTPLPEALQKMSAVRGAVDRDQIDAEYLNGAVARARTDLDSLQRRSIDSLNLRITEADADDKRSALLKLGSRWLDFRQPDLDAYYTVEANRLEPFDQPLAARAAAKAATAAQLSPDTAARSYFGSQATEIYRQLIDTYPDSTRYAIELATLMIDGQQQVMQGVLLLREVIEKDSLNLQANLTLGRLSVVSGQFDKAIGRLNTVLRQQPRNAEALYFLGEAHVGLNQIDKAIEVFERVKAIADNPAFEREIDKYIQQIANQ